MQHTAASVPAEIPVTPEQLAAKEKAKLAEAIELGENSPIQRGLPPDQTIQQIVAVVKGISINGITDKAGADMARKYLRGMVKIRTGIEAKRKELVSPWNGIVSEINAEAKRLTALAKPGEDHISAVVQQYDNAVAEAERAEKARRHQLMLDSGFTFSGGLYFAGPFNYGQEQVFSVKEETLVEIAARGLEEKARTEAEAKRKAEEDAKRQAELEELRRLQAQLAAQQQQIVPATEPTPAPPAPTYQPPSRTAPPTQSAPAYATQESDKLMEAFTRGFEACKGRIMQRLNDAAPITRGELKEFVSSLQPRK